MMTPKKIVEVGALIVLFIILAALLIKGLPWVAKQGALGYKVSVLRDEAKVSYNAWGEEVIGQMLCLAEPTLKMTRLGRDNYELYSGRLERLVKAYENGEYIRTDSFYQLSEDILQTIKEVASEVFAQEHGYYPRESELAVWCRGTGVYRVKHLKEIHGEIESIACDYPMTKWENLGFFWNLFGQAEEELLEALYPDIFYSADG